MSIEPDSPPSSTDFDDTSDIQDQVVLRLAKNDTEIRDAQKLRYIVFYEEFGAKAPDDVAKDRRDHDDYDAYADHLIIIDEERPIEDGQIVGTYRLFQKERLPESMDFYTSHEFDITQLTKNGGKLLELGRSCVLPDYRTKHVMQKLWGGLAEYVSDNQIDLMFGCASLQGTSPEAACHQLAYLHYYHAPPEELLAKATVDCTAQLHFPPKEQINARRVFASLPPLIKGYLRVGAYIGQGAYLDHDFNCIDVCIILPTAKVESRYAKHYERKLQRDIVADAAARQNPTK